MEKEGERGDRRTKDNAIINNILIMHLQQEEKVLTFADEVAVAVVVVVVAAVAVVAGDTFAFAFPLLDSADTRFFAEEGAYC